MTAKVAYGEYKKNKVITASGVELIVQLYDEAIKNIQIASAVMRGNSKLTYEEIKRKSKAITKSLNIVTGLADSLDMDKGGEIAVNLGKLYEFVNMRLLNANVNNDPVMLDEALRILNELREAWVGILKQGSKEKREEAERSHEKGGQVPVPAGGDVKRATVYNRFALKT